MTTKIVDTEQSATISLNDFMRSTRINATDTIIHSVNSRNQQIILVKITNKNNHVYMWIRPKDPLATTTGQASSITEAIREQLASNHEVFVETNSTLKIVSNEN